MARIWGRKTELTASVSQDPIRAGSTASPPRPSEEPSRDGERAPHHNGTIPRSPLRAIQQTHTISDLVARKLEREIRESRIKFQKNSGPRHAPLALRDCESRSAHEGRGTRKEKGSEKAFRSPDTLLTTESVVTRYYWAAIMCPELPGARQYPSDNPIRIPSQYPWNYQAALDREGRPRRGRSQVLFLREPVPPVFSVESSNTAIGMTPRWPPRGRLCESPPPPCTFFHRVTSFRLLY
jgi:hypothetical protein